MINAENKTEDRVSYIVTNNLKKYRNLFMRCCEARLKWEKHSIIRRNGEKTDGFYFLLDGIVKIYTTNCVGYERILGYHKSNTLFGMDGICPESTAAVSIAAITDIHAIHVRMSDLTLMGKIDPTLPYALLEYYGLVLRLMCLDAEAKSLPDVPSRLASFICLYLENNEDSMEIKMTQEELASAVNASRVQVCRICSNFQNKGLIRCKRGVITVIDRNELKKISLSNE